METFENYRIGFEVYTKKRGDFMANRKMAVGEAVIEFYASLDTIKDYYENRGYRKISLLHKLLKEKLGWRMGYDTFRYHFNKEFKRSKNSSFNSTEKQSNKKGEGEKSSSSSSKKKPHEPIIATFSMSDITPYNPHTSPIDESRILR